MATCDTVVETKFILVDRRGMAILSVGLTTAHVQMFWLCGNSYIWTLCFDRTLVVFVQPQMLLGSWGMVLLLSPCSLNN